jgi:hypothetical protein
MNFASSDIRDSAKSTAGDGNAMISTPLTLVMNTVFLGRVNRKVAVPIDNYC